MFGDICLYMLQEYLAPVLSAMLSGVIVVDDVNDTGNSRSYQ